MKKAKADNNLRLLEIQLFASILEGRHPSRSLPRARLTK